MGKLIIIFALNIMSQSCAISCSWTRHTRWTQNRTYRKAVFYWPMALFVRKR